MHQGFEHPASDHHQLCWRGLNGALVMGAALCLAPAPGLCDEGDDAKPESIYDALTFGSDSEAPAEPTPGSVYKSLTFTPAAAKTPEAKEGVGSGQPAPPVPKIGLEAILEQQKAGTYKPFDAAMLQPPAASPQAAPAAPAERSPMCDGVDALVAAAPGGFDAIKGEESSSMVTSWASTVTPVGASKCSIMNGAAGAFVSCRVSAGPEGVSLAKWQAVGAEVSTCLEGWGDELRDGVDEGERVRIFLSGFGGAAVQIQYTRSVIRDGEWDVGLRVVEHGI